MPPVNSCLACAHPASELINEFCFKRKVEIEGTIIRTAKELIDALERIYPDAKCPNEASLSKHGKRHLPKTGVLQVINGVLCDSDKKPLPGYGLIETARAIINIGVMNILNNPESVSPKHLYDFLHLLYKMQNGISESDEYQKLWSGMLANEPPAPKRRGPQRKAVLVNDEDAIEGECKSI